MNTSDKKQNAIRQFCNQLNGTDIPMIEEPYKRSVVYNGSYKQTSSRPNLYAYRIRTGQAFKTYLSNEEISNNLKRR